MVKIDHGASGMPSTQQSSQSNHRFPLRVSVALCLRARFPPRVSSSSLRVATYSDETVSREPCSSTSRHSLGHCQSQRNAEFVSCRQPAESNQLSTGWPRKVSRYRVVIKSHRKVVNEVRVFHLN